MDKDQVGGKLDQAVGWVKQKTGETVGDDQLANQGVADQVKGSAKETWGNVKDATRTATGTHTGAGTHTTGTTTTGTTAEGTDTRNGIRDSVVNAKNKINDAIDDFKDKNR